MLCTFRNFLFRSFQSPSGSRSFILSFGCCWSRWRFYFVNLIFIEYHWRRLKVVWVIDLRFVYVLYAGGITVNLFVFSWSCNDLFFFLFDDCGLIIKWYTIAILDCYRGNLSGVLSTIFYYLVEQFYLLNYRFAFLQTRNWFLFFLCGILISFSDILLWLIHFYNRYAFEQFLIETIFNECLFNTDSSFFNAFHILEIY